MNLIEYAATHNAPIPKEADVFDTLDYLTLKGIFSLLVNGDITKEQATQMKVLSLGKIEDLRESFKFQKKCWESAAARYKKTEAARRAYGTDRTLENADALMAAIDGLEI